MNKTHAIKFYTKLAGQYGFKLIRWKKHLVFRNDQGKTFVVSSTTSDPRSIKNHFSDLKRLIQDNDSDHTS
jgi:hypothetical protein